MKDLFISYAEEDHSLAEELADRLEAFGYTTWHFVRDALPGVSHLEQTSNLIAQCQAVILIASPVSLQSHQVHTEVVHAHELSRPIVPVLRDVSYHEVQRLRPVWCACFQAASAIRLAAEGPATIGLPLLAGLRQLDVWPRMPLSERQGPLRLQSSRASASTAVVRAMGEIDVANSEHFKQALLEALEHGARCVVIDLSLIEYMDSGAIGILVGMLKRIRDLHPEPPGAVRWAERHLPLVGVQPRLRRVFEITGLDRIFYLYDTLEEALAALPPELPPPSVRRRGPRKPASPKRRRPR